MKESFPAKKILALCFALSAVVLGFRTPLRGQWFFDFENGLALPGYNDVRIPGDRGTLFSLTEELKIDPAYFFRLRAGYQWKKGHHLSIFASPLRLKAEGTVRRIHLSVLSVNRQQKIRSRRSDPSSEGGSPRTPSANSV